MRGPAVVAGLLLAMSVRADPMCPVLPGPFTQGTVCPFPDPSMCFTAQNANVIVQALADVCALTESLDASLATSAQVAGDLGGTAASPQVVATHLAAPLPGAQGGLGVSQPACAGGQFLTCDGTRCTCGTPGVGGASVIISQAARPATVDLPSEGTGDWLVYNSTSAFDYGSVTLPRKRLGGGQIAGVGFIGGGSKFNNQADGTTMSWTAADSITNAAGTSAVHAGVYAQTGAGVRLAVPAGTQSRRLRLYVANYKSTAELRCRLSDGSADDATVSVTTAGSSAYVLEVVYKAAHEGAQMFVSFTISNLSASDGNVVFSAATLSTPFSG